MEAYKTDKNHDVDKAELTPENEGENAHKPNTILLDTSSETVDTSKASDADKQTHHEEGAIEKSKIVENKSDTVNENPVDKKEVGEPSLEDLISRQFGKEFKFDTVQESNSLPPFEAWFTSEKW